MRVAYVTPYDPNDRTQWSGLGYAVMKALRSAGLQVTAFGPLPRNFQLIGGLKERFCRRVFRCSYDIEREAVVQMGYAKQILAKLNQEDYDFVFALESFVVSRLSCRQPIAIWVDCTYASWISHYRLDKQLCRSTIRAGHSAERRTFDRCALIFCASDWAAASAIDDYGVDPSKVRVVPFGANLDNPPDRDPALHNVRTRAADSCRLITIGLDWFRKGIPRAIELTSLLNHRGLPTELTVVGSKPPAGVSVPDFVNIVGPVDKRNLDGEKKFSSLLASSHFHVLFSVAEAFGVVFAEANAHAVPNIASDVGGIGSAVINGYGGQRFSQATPIEEIADYIEILVRDRVRYVGLASRARKQYENWLKWSVAGAAVRKHLEALA